MFLPRKRRVVLALISGLVLVLVTPAMSMFTGFDANPAAGALQAADAVRMNDNPAQEAVPEPSPYINQRSAVSANTSTASSQDANISQATSTGINDRIRFRTDRSFDNIYLDQEAVSRIHQDCRTRGTCEQDANTNVSQGADIQIDGRFTNVFLTQDARSYVDQRCTAGACRQTGNARIDQDADFTRHWTSNGFVTRHREDTVHRYEHETGLDQ